MSSINIKNVAKYYAELPNQNKGLDILQSALDKVGLANEDQEWVQEFRKAEKAEVKLELPKSLAATESHVLPFTGKVDWDNMRSRVSKYFTVQDVTNGDRRRLPTDPRIVKNILYIAKEADKVREAWNNPIGVTSFYRPPAINRAVGGSRGSQHQNGIAMDIFPMAGGNIHQFQKWLDSVWLDRLGLGSHKGFVHIDAAGGGGYKRLGNHGKVRWTY